MPTNKDQIARDMWALLVDYWENTSDASLVTHTRDEATDIIDAGREAFFTHLDRKE